MNREKLATIGCIVISIIFTLLIGLFIHFKVLLPFTSYNYSRCLYYPEDLYKEYRKEAERMITKNEYTCQYLAKSIFESEEDRTTLVIQIGEYDTGDNYGNYITATVKNFGTNEQEVTFERSRKSAEDAYKEAENYKKTMNIFTAIFVLILGGFTVYLIKNSIKRHYRKVFKPMIFIVIFIAAIIFFRNM